MAADRDAPGEEEREPLVRSSGWLSGSGCSRYQTRPGAEALPVQPWLCSRPVALGWLSRLWGSRGHHCPCGQQPPALSQVTQWPLALWGLPQLAGAALPARRAAGRDAGSPPKTARTARGSHRAGGRERSGSEPTTAAELCFNFPRDPRVYENVKIYCLTLPSG